MPRMDDELPPDPFPGDPFAEKSEGTSNKDPKNPKNSDPNDTGGFDLSALAGLFGGVTGGGANPFAGLLSQLGGGGQGFNYDVARHTAIWSAAGGEVEPNLDPMERIGFEDLLRRVFPVVSSTLSIDGIKQPSIEATTRAGFAAEFLLELRPLFNAMAGGLTNPSSTSSRAEAEDDDESEFAAIGQMMAMFGPMTLAPQVGSLIGEVAKHALGSSDLLLARESANNRLLVVPANITAFANEWSIPEESARVHAVTVALAIQSVLSVPHIKKRLRALLEAHAAATRVDTTSMTNNIQGLLGSMGGPDGIDLTAFGIGASGSLGSDTFDANNPNIRALTGERGIPGIVETAEQAQIRRSLRTLLIPIVGVIDYTVAVAGARLLGDNRQVMEAWRRRRANPDDTTKALSLLLGCATPIADVDAATAFVGGVMQRVGPSGFEPLWTSDESLPTEAEIAAPGLWLARLGLTN
jgi:putative hydrolase